MTKSVMRMATPAIQRRQSNRIRPPAERLSLPADDDMKTIRLRTGTVPQRYRQSKQRFGNGWTATLEQVIPALDWAAIRHRDGIPADGVPPVLGADVAVDRSAAAIVACWPDAAGFPTLEQVEYGAGAAWVAGRLRQLHAAHGGPVVLDGGTGPASTVVDALRGKDGELPDWVRALTPRELSTACAQLLDGVTDRTIRQRGNTELDAAVKAAAKRTTGDGWVWSRRTPTVDVSPLLAGSLALYGDRHRPPAPVRPQAYAG